MTPEKRKRLAYLQDVERVMGKQMVGPEVAELESLRRELAMAPEVADDPKTLFTDESRRPQLDGTDYLDEQKKRDCREWVERIEAEAVKLGEVAIRAAIAALTARLGT